MHSSCMPVIHALLPRKLQEVLDDSVTGYDPGHVSEEDHFTKIRNSVRGAGRNVAR